MFQFLEEHPYFISKSKFNNSDGHKYGMATGLCDGYTLTDSEGGTLRIFINGNNEFDWSYEFPKKPYFIQRCASPIENGPLWMQELLIKVEGAVN